MFLSVIISTYNSPASLLRTIYSLEAQTYRNFEVVIADDGSGPETADVIKRARAETGLAIQHIWHEDQGFRKNTILNRAVLASQGPYLVFLDGDCLARADMIATHIACAQPHQALSGGSQIDLPAAVHSSLSRQTIREGRPFDPRWLKQHGVSLSGSWEKQFRLICRPGLGRLLDFFLPRAAGFVGCNSSVWKADVLRVNGFDEQLTYGAEDKDLGIRLINGGVRSRRLKYSLVYLHLDHKRPYANGKEIRRNKVLVHRRRHSRTTWIGSGIDKVE